VRSTGVSKSKLMPPPNVSDGGSARRAPDASQQRGACLSCILKAVPDRHITVAGPSSTAGVIAHKGLS
jgi:hypothetical protein